MSEMFPPIVDRDHGDEDDYIDVMVEVMRGFVLARENSVGLGGSAAGIAVAPDSVINQARRHLGMRPLSFLPCGVDALTWEEA